MSLTILDEYNEYNMIVSMDFNDLIDKLYYDINNGHNINWLYNRFISPNLYYKLINKLDYNTSKKFNKINKYLVLNTKSKLSYNEIDNIISNLYINDENEYYSNINDNYDEDDLHDDKYFNIKISNSKYDKE